MTRKTRMKPVRRWAVVLGDEYIFSDRTKKAATQALKDFKALTLDNSPYHIVRVRVEEER